MRAVQVVIRVPVMVEGDRSPVVADVTGIAAGSEMAVVIVVVAVTGHAGGLELVGERVVAVAIAAAQLPVVAVQDEVGVARVAETGVVPSCRAVTILAFSPALAVMRVVFGMTREARRRCALERVVLVTIEAGRIGMIANQLKSRGVVIEADIRPSRRRMAIAALGPDGVVVDVVFLVAADAGLRCFAVLVARFVTAFARRLIVFADEGEVSVLVPEGLGVQVDDNRVTPFVICMAVSTAACFGALEAAVETH